MTKTIKCENCGGAIDLKENCTISFCPYCGSAVKRDETYMDELRLKLQHEKEQKEAEAKEKRRDDLFTWLGFLGILSFGFLWFYVIRPLL